MSKKTSKDLARAMIQIDNLADELGRDRTIILELQENHRLQAGVVDAARNLLENHQGLIPAGSIVKGELTGPASISVRWLWDAVKAHDKEKT